MQATKSFSESHRRRLLANAQYADRLISDIEEILRASESKSPFPKYRPDVSLHQARLIRSHISRFRDHLGRVLSAVGIEHDSARFGSLHSIRVTLTFVRIAVQEMNPEYLRGYGDLPEGTASELRGLCIELEGLIDNLERNLALGSAVDLQARLNRLEGTTKEADLLRLLDRIIQDDELAEFRASLLNIVEKLESPLFEIAVFGRVSSGKSSLLNHVLATDVLPVGVNPITAVPTRILYGQEARLTVTLSDREVLHRPIGDLAEYASEEKNPGNALGIIRLVVALPSPRLQKGLVLVDTPGLGALATAGAAETLSYLPQCDLGILLLSAVNPINEEDLNTIQALSQAGIPVMGLLSKADLLSRADRGKTLDYTKKEVLANLGLTIDIYPVSTVGTDEEMLTDWFRRNLEPLLGRHRELAQASIRRKTGALRESVMAALRLKLGTCDMVPVGIGIPLEEVERRLRTAAGEIEEVRRFCLAATDEVRDLHETALRRSADAVLRSWDGQDDDRQSCTGIIGRTAELLAAEAASQISGQLNGLAQQLQSALTFAAEALQETSSSQDSHLQDWVREMPRFEAAVPEISIARPWFGTLRGLAMSWVARRLTVSVSSGLEEGFKNYGRALQSWVQRILADLQQGFDSSADAYRAQLARRMNRKALSSEQRAQVEGHLAEIEAFGPRDSSSIRE